jgi:hypothetical protein
MKKQADAPLTLNTSIGLIILMQGIHGGFSG